MTKEQSQVWALKSAIANMRLEGYALDKKAEKELLEMAQNPSSKANIVAGWKEAMKRIEA